MNFNNNFQGKTVLLTGHTGLKGSWMSIWLNELGAKVIGFALEPNTKEDNFVLSHLNEKIISIIGDVRDYQHMFNVFQEYKPDVVFHLAAQPIVRESYINPKETYDINIGGTVNVLECVRLSESVKTTVIITSDKCYENREVIWGYREIDPMGGADPYSSSKGCVELITSAYRHSFFNPDQFEMHEKTLSSVRAGNIIGGGDWQKDRLIPDAIRALEAGKPIPIRNPSAVRPWQYILEPLYGYLTLAQKMETDPVLYSSAWNFGPESSSFVPVSEVVDLVVNEWGEGKWEEIISPNSQPHEATVLNIDITKAKTYLGWQPRLTLKEAISATVDWYKHQTDSMYDFCVKQVHKYL